MITEIELEDMLGKLDSEEGRTMVIAGLIGRMDLPERYHALADRLTKDPSFAYREVPRLAEEARTAMSAGKPDVAILTYEKAGWFRAARYEAQIAGRTDRAELYGRIVHLFDLVR